MLVRRIDAYNSAETRHPATRGVRGPGASQRILLTGVRIVRVAEREQILRRARWCVRVRLFFGQAVIDAPRNSRATARRLEGRETRPLVIIPDFRVLEQRDVLLGHDVVER